MANNIILNRLFTIAAFQELIEETNSRIYSDIINRYVNTTDIPTNAEAITEIYSFMRKKYRNQYYYKNTILNKLLLGVHSINTTTALTEIPISTSKADFLLINGKAVVYEIKTELDNLDRLESQIQNYYKAFDHVCVLTCDEYARTLLERFKNTSVGIYVLTKRETISRLKEPETYSDLLDLNVMFKVLNKPEFEKIIFQYYKELPKISQVKYYSKCQECFCNIPLKDAYLSFLKVLKTRNKVSDVNLFNMVPYELKSLVYFSQYRNSDYLNLENFLVSKIGGNL